MTTLAYVPILIKKIVSGRSTITRLERFDPLLSNKLKSARETQDRVPEDLLIQRRPALPHRAIPSWFHEV